jgi:photosystem II stability/assembly factor-like uncharacterized protein
MKNVLPQRSRASLVLLLVCGALASACVSAAPPHTSPSATAEPASTKPAAHPSALASPTAGPGHVISVSFVSPTHGWVGRGITQDDGQILVTHDGGLTWTQQYRGNIWPSYMQFVDDDHGWVSGCILSTGSDGHCDSPFLETSDGGVTWQPLPSYPPMPAGEVRGIDFIDARHGWIMTQNDTALFDHYPNVISETDDAGATWRNLTLPDSADPFAMQRLDANHAWIESTDAIWSTSDDGASWLPMSNPCHAPQPADADTYRPSKADFIDPSDGWLGCNASNGGGGMLEKTLYRTHDAGKTWMLVGQAARDPTPSPPPNLPILGGVSDIHFFDDSDGWLDLDGPESFLFRTTDGGRTWSAVDDHTGGGIQHLLFVGRTYGWAWGSDTILRTTDGGSTWVTITAP